MPRIRTIKPEFTQSEKIGRLSREARLLFVQLWTFVDDHGRCRGSSRLLAASLYPYDDDAITLIDGWLSELESENCIRRYVIDGTTYLDIPNWGKHQRIDNAGKSRIPEFCGDSPRVSESDGDPPLYLGPSTKDLGPRTEDNSSLRSEPAGARETFSDDWPPDYREQFWAKYPRKVGRKSAFRKLEAIRRSGEVTWERLCGGILKIPKDEPKFIPHPLTWLNRGGWDDEEISQVGGENVQRKRSVQDAAADLVNRMREFDRPAPSDIRSGEGGSVVRLLSQG